VVGSSRVGFFDQIVYSSANEDGRSELRALAPGPGDHVVAVCGSGARALDLLVSDAARVTAVDFNVHQLRLLALKVAGYRTLEHAHLLAFLGVRTAERGRLYAQVRAALAPDDRAYWDARPQLIEDGVLYAGAWERFFRLFAAAAWPKRRALARLFAASTLEEQRRIWVEEWDDWRWRLGLRLLGSRLVWRYALQEPGAALVPPDVDLAARVAALFDAASRRHLFRDNAYLHVLLTGAYGADGPLPLHLRPEHHDRVRSRVDRLDWAQAPLHEHLLAPEQRGRYHGFSLSDLSSYADAATYEATWRGVRHASAPGARICERHFLSPRPPPEDLARDPALEAELAASDDTFLYTFVVGRW
jgi:S-adenosylmethionine-diacylglycerol 3-amino-3-carboxypropyl transferase